MEKKVPFTQDWGANMVRTQAWTDTNKTIYQSSQDVSAIYEMNKYLQKEQAVIHNSKFERGKRWRKLATIPNIIVDDLMRKGIWQDRKRMRKWLNDSNNKAWRVEGGYL